MAEENEFFRVRTSDHARQVSRHYLRPFRIRSEVTTMELSLDEINTIQDALEVATKALPRSRRGEFMRLGYRLEGRKNIIKGKRKDAF